MRCIKCGNDEGFEHEEKYTYVCLKKCNFRFAACPDCEVAMMDSETVVETATEETEETEEEDSFRSLNIGEGANDEVF